VQDELCGWVGFRLGLVLGFGGVWDVWFVWFGVGG